ncbi:MAG: aldolase/citrate lyase family protein, partial [Bacteroidota bacterium]
MGNKSFHFEELTQLLNKYELNVRSDRSAMNNVFNNYKPTTSNIMNPVNSTAAVEKLYTVLKEDGVAVLPSDLGYGILSITLSGMLKLYELKNRPLEKPSGIIGTPKIFKHVSRSRFRDDVKEFAHPVGLITELNTEAELITKLPDPITPEQTIGVFMNLNPLMTKLADYAFEQGDLIIISSANKAGTGNVFRMEDLHPPLREGADYIQQGDFSRYHKERGHFEQITTTIIDLTESKVKRAGVFVESVTETAARLGMIDRDEIIRARPENPLESPFRSCIFMKSYDEKSFDRINRTSHADWIALDLEDGCPAELKPPTRRLIEKHLAGHTLKRRRLLIRLNSLDEIHEVKKDLDIQYTKQVTGFALPMLRNAADLKRFETLISEMEDRLDFPEGTFKFFPIIETPEALLNALEIAKGSPRNLAILIGHADLTGATQANRTSKSLLHLRQEAILAARAAGLKIFDTPYENVRDYDGLEKDANESRKLGFDGKVALSLDQIDPINRVFGISKSDALDYQQAIETYNGQIAMRNGRFIAPPIIKRMQNELKRKVYEPHVKASVGVKGKKMKYGLDYQNAHPGQIIPSPYEISVDASWVSSWQHLVPTFNPLETSRPYSEKLGLKDQLLPYQMLVNLGLCMAVECYSESCKYHLGVHDVIYERAAYPNDTLRSVVRIDNIKNLKSGKYSLIETRLIILNQHDERVLIMKRNSLFPRIEGLEHKTFPSPPQSPYQSKFDIPIFNELRTGILKQAVNLQSDMLHYQNDLEAGDLWLHGLVRPVGLSGSVMYSTLCKNTHPLHINHIRYGMDKLVVSGGFVLPIVLGAAQRDLKHSLHEQLIDTMHINPIKHDDGIGAISYILEKQDMGAGFEALTIRTLGIKNIDIENELEDVSIPMDLLVDPVKII